MTIHSDSISSASAPSPERLDRHGAEARQGRWMLELERGMFAAGAREAAPGAQQAKARAPAPRVDPPAAPPDALAPPAGEGGDPGKAAARPPTAGSGGLVAHAKGHAGNAALPAAGRPFVAGATALWIAPGPALQLTAGVADTDPPAPSQARRTAGVAIAVLAAQCDAAPELCDSETRPLPAEPSPPEPAPGGRPEFDKRLLHIYLKHDGVHAFIRDANLGAAQMPALVQALSAELGAAGRSLAALTVNGRAVDARDAPQPAASFPTIVRKGHPQ